MRVAGVFVLLYGVFGLLLVAVGYNLANESFAQLEALQRSLAGQRAGLVGSLRSADRALGDATTTFDDFGKTLDQSRQSAQQAAELARQTSDSMTQIGQAMQISVFGYQPFGQLSGNFYTASEQLVQLGKDLDATGTALGQNTRDIGTAKANIADLRTQVQAVARAFDATPLLGGPPEALQPFRLATYGLLVWLAGQALMSVVLGVWLFRHAHLRLAAARAALAAAPELPALRAPQHDEAA